MQLSRRRALTCGIVAIVGVILLQAFNSFACYHMSFFQFLSAWTIFVSVPLVPACIGLVTKNPLRAVGSCLLFAPWLLLAYYTDCIRPRSGGGASMIYVAVLLWGTPCAVIGALITGPVMRACKVTVDAR
jgi:hypothetical protein